VSKPVRNFIDIINEATRPTKTGTRDKTDQFDFMPSLEPGGAVAPAAASKKDVAPKTLPGRKAKHRFKAIDLGDDPELGAQVGQHLGALGQADIADEIDDAEARRRAGIEDMDTPDTIGGVPEVPNIENLPAIISREMTTTGTTVNHLPGYIQQPIRALGRQIFGQFTDTPIEDIQMIGTIGNINPERDVRGMMAWITRNGIRDETANIDFNRIMPGYTAETSLWNTDDFTFLLVKDMMGYYIYGWVNGRGTKLDGDPLPKMIR
jgi:hypothetical protein